VNNCVCAQMCIYTTAAETTSTATTIVAESAKNNEIHISTELFICEDDEDLPSSSSSSE